MAPKEAPNCTLCIALKLLHSKQLVALHTLLYLRKKKCLAVMAIKGQTSDRKQLLLVSMCQKVQYARVINTVSVLSLKPTAVNFSYSIGLCHTSAVSSQQPH